jgi:hypothetical protein
MKQQDIAVIIVIIFFAGIFSFLVSNKFISPSDKKLNAEVVEEIQSDLMVPDKTVFNAEAINPTVRIQIAPSSNAQPFNNSN